MQDRRPGGKPAAALHVVAWLTLLSVAVLTVVPGTYRPSLGFHGRLDAAVAFAVLGAVLGTVYRRHPITVMWVIAMAACGLELAQLLAPGRHTHVRGAEVKAVAGVLGMGFGIFGLKLIELLRRR